MLWRREKTKHLIGWTSFPVESLPRLLGWVEGTIQEVPWMQHCTNIDKISCRNFNNTKVHYKKLKSHLHPIAMRFVRDVVASSIRGRGLCLSNWTDLWRRGWRIRGGNARRCWGPTSPKWTRYENIIRLIQKSAVYPVSIFNPVGMANSCQN